MDKFEIRRLRLIKIKDEKCNGVIRVLAEKLVKPKPGDPNAHISESYVSRMLYPAGQNHKKNIGDDIVEVIQKSFGLPAGWMDGVDAGAWPFTKFTPAEFEALNPNAKKYIEDWVAARIAEQSPLEIAHPTFAKKISA